MLLTVPVTAGHIARGTPGRGDDCAVWHAIADALAAWLTGGSLEDLLCIMQFHLRDWCAEFSTPFHCQVPLLRAPQNFIDRFDVTGWLGTARPAGPWEFTLDRTDPVTGERKRFSSAIVPPWARKTPKITEVLPLLYLHGLSSGGFVPAPGQFLGSSAGLSAAVITRLTETWRAEQRALRDLSHVDYVYLWADGIHVNIRLEEHKLCLLVLIGVRADGRKELVALADGYRESAESWADLLRGCARRGTRAPVLAVGDGALGFWGGLREVFPEAKEGRCWFHKTANVLAALPKSAHPGAKKALAAIWGAEDKEHARAAVKAFEAAYGVKFPKAVAKITDDAEELLAFYDYPAEHWVHLRTTNPIESTFATVRHRTKVTKCPGSRAAGLAMAFKLIESAQDRWHAVNAPHLVALVRAGATFTGGRLVERPAGEAQPEAA
jgi:transposase-like protein